MADLFRRKNPRPRAPAAEKVDAARDPRGKRGLDRASGWHMKEIAPFPGSGVLATGGMGSAIAAEQRCPRAYCCRR